MPSHATSSVGANFFLFWSSCPRTNSVSQFGVFFPYFCTTVIERRHGKNSALKLHLKVYIGNIAKCVGTRHRLPKDSFFFFAKCSSNPAHFSLRPHLGPKWPQFCTTPVGGGPMKNNALYYYTLPTSTLIDRQHNHIKQVQCVGCGPPLLHPTVFCLDVT